MKMKIFVTGGAGFIGKHLAKVLIEQNHEVTIYDNFSNSAKDDLDKSPFNKAHIITGDIGKFEDILKSSVEIDVMIHLAAKISVSESISNPKETFDTNVNGTENVLKACNANKIKKFFALSSAAVYGNNNNPNHISIENDNTHPISPYGESKLRMEEKIIDFSNNYKMNSIIFRLFNVYGEGQSVEYAGVISKFAEQIRKNMPLIIFGDGHQTRDFVAIEDVVNLITRLISSNIEKRGEIYNVGCGDSISILELANLMKKLSKRQLETKFESNREGEIEYSEASIKKSQEELNYIPRVKLSQGLMKFF